MTRQAQERESDAPGTTGQPIVSVITPAYNAERTIAESVASVQAQTFRNWELIIVDDSSEDGTRPIVQSLMRDARIRLEHTSTRGGASAARNLGATVASGHHLVFLDSDDVWLPRKLEAQIRYHEQHPGCIVSHTDYQIVNHRGNARRVRLRRLDWLTLRRGRLLPLLYIRNVVGTSTVLVERRVFLEHGGFDETLRACEDQDLWIRIAEAGHRFGYLPDILTRHRRSPTSLSAEPGILEDTWMAVLRKRVLTNDKVRPRTKRLAQAYFYAYFGRRRLASKDYHVAHRYFGLAVRSNPAGIVTLVAAPFWAVTYILHSLERR